MYFIRYLGQVIRLLVLILPKISRYVKTFKDKGQFKNKNNQLMYLVIYNDNLVEKYETIWNKVEDFKIYWIWSVGVYDDRYIKMRIRTYDDRVYTNLQVLIVPKDGIECESFTVISIDFWLVYKNKYYLEVHLNSWVYKIVDKQMANYLDFNKSMS